MSTPLPSTLLCSLSGTVPTHPVVSVKSGHIYEKSVIESHINKLHTDPHTGQPLELTDLIELQFPSGTNSTLIRPRPPTSTSLPSLLALFQSEWDATLVELHTLKQNNDALKKELAYALYQHDAACRVIARLMKERDDARAALSNTAANLSSAVSRPSAGSAPMEAENENELTPQIAATITETAQTLSKQRKAHVKSLQASVTPKEKLAAYTATASHPLHSTTTPGITCVDISPKYQSLLVTGGNDHNAIVFNKDTGKIVDTLKHHKKKITDVKFHPTESLVFTTSADATTCFWSESDGKYELKATFADHSGAVNGLTLHPSGAYAVTAGNDGQWILYDIHAARKQLVVPSEQSGLQYSRVVFHADGQLIAVAASDQIVKIFDVKQKKNVANFKGHTGDVTGLSFSQNGYYLSSGDATGAVKIWDLRKLNNAPHSIELGSAVYDVAFDESGSYLGAAAANEMKVYGSKEWDVVATWKDHKSEVTGVRFGSNASFVASVSKDRTLKIYQ